MNGKAKDISGKTDMALVAAASHGMALAATSSNGKTDMTEQTGHYKPMQRASNGKMGSAIMIGGQVTARIITGRTGTPGQASNGKIGPNLPSIGIHGSRAKKMTDSQQWQTNMAGMS